MIPLCLLKNCNQVLQNSIAVYFLKKPFFIDLRGRGRETEKSMDVREKHRWAASYTPPTEHLVHSPWHVP